MLDAIKHVVDDSKTASAVVCSTQPNCCSPKLLNSFLLSCGPITVQSLTPLI